MPERSRPTGPLRWLRATRPGFLTITLVAVLVGLASATAGRAAPAPIIAALSLLGALLAHAGANVINDVHDAAGDAANDERITPFTGGSRVIQLEIVDIESMRRLAAGLFAATALTGLALLAVGPPGLIAFGLAGVGLAWSYSAPPCKLMARGLGELAVAAGWLLVVAGTDYALRAELAPAAWLAGAGLALQVANILFINQFPDHRADAAIGKRNCVVRLGPKRAARLYPAIALAAHALPVVAVVAGALPPATLIGLAAAPFSWHAWRILRDNAEFPARLAGAIRATLAAAHVHGLLLAAGLFLSAG